MAIKNTNRISLVLAYAALEMILIVLLFINGFFSYVIGKFADRFRLKKPCFWCSRIDHLFEAGKVNDCRSLLCEEHSMEISRLRYCFDHKRLAEFNAMCRDCCSSEKGTEVVREENRLYSRISNLESEEEVGFRLVCSCCGSSLEKKVVFLDCDSINSERVDDEDDLVGGKIEFGDFTNPNFVDEKPDILAGEAVDIADVSVGEDASPRPHLEFLIDTNSRHLIPVLSDDEAGNIPNLRENDSEHQGLEKEAETHSELIPEEDGELQEELPLLHVSKSGAHEAPNNEDVVSVKNGIAGNTRNEGDEAIPDTPTSIESFHHIHKKLQTLERRESWAESNDGSMISEIETGDTSTMIEKLKTALRTERKALRSLYEELEEERNASAVAANQTMAMINRLQEEKAVMQMEALHYQRMMDEQTEYDQEALQLLNELMRKRESEKEELERELTFYRRRLEDYEGEEEAESVMYLEGFETERESILQQVKTLENKFGNGTIGGDSRARKVQSILNSSQEGERNGTENGHGCDVEEVGHVYERLDALEEDCEFLKHCILSLKKGGKGVELLEEILHHLRHLRSVQTLV